MDEYLYIKQGKLEDRFIFSDQDLWEVSFALYQRWRRTAIHVQVWNRRFASVHKHYLYAELRTASTTSTFITRFKTKRLTKRHFVVHGTLFRSLNIALSLSLSCTPPFPAPVSTHHSLPHLHLSTVRNILISEIWYMCIRSVQFNRFLRSLLADKIQVTLLAEAEGFLIQLNPPQNLFYLDPY